MNQRGHRVALLDEDLLGVADPDRVLVIALGQALGQRGNQGAERLSHELLSLRLARAKQGDENLEHNLLGSLVRLQKVADVDERPLLAADVLGLEVVPTKLDELLAVSHELVGEVADEQRAHAQELNPQGVRVRRRALVIRRLQHVHDDGVNDILGDYLLRLLHLVGVDRDVLERVLQHRQHDELERVDELGNLQRPLLEAIQEVDDHRVPLLGRPLHRNLLLVKFFHERVVHAGPRREDREDVEEVGDARAVVRGDVEEALDQLLGLEQFGKRERLFALEPGLSRVAVPPLPQRLDQVGLRR